MVKQQTAISQNFKKIKSQFKKAYFGLPTAKLLNCRPEEKQAARKKMGNFKPKEQQKQLIRSIFLK